MQMTRGVSLTVLGIETSCDETAAAVVRGHPDGARAILAEALHSQTTDHAPYGGVVPEIAARAHIAHLDGLIARAMADAGLGFHDLDAVAATAGPGLIGGVIVGLMTAKGIAFAADKPLTAINHLEGHALSPRLTTGCPFPYLLLLVSGGHCQILMVHGPGTYRRLGTTIDDAAGEAFDKVAKMLSLGYPGGPAVERMAGAGDPERFAFPRPLTNRPGCDFSFSGLKTAVLREANALAPITDPDVADLCASFQAAVTDCLADRTANAIAAVQRDTSAQPTTLVVAGGVAANTAIRERLTALAADQGLSFLAPPLKLCTDNAAMIAWAGIERLAAGLDDTAHGLSAAPRARWPLDPDAPRALGAGVKA